MLKVGVIGCGNAGNQTVDVIATKYPDIPVLAINCSENDLATIGKNILKKTIGDGKGAGKNRAESKKFLAQGINDLVSDDDVKKFMKELEFVFVVSSTGGGTGSGMSLLLTKILEKGFPNVFKIPVGILPSVSEAQSTQSNTLEYLAELYTLLGDCTYMLYDNERGAGMPTSKMMDAVNNQIAEDINVIRGFYNHPTKYTSIDEKDARVIITAPGRLMVVSLFNLSDRAIESRGIEDMLCDVIKNTGYHCPIQRDKIVNKLGVIVNLYEDLLNDFDSSLPKVQALIGTPVEGFEHLAESDNRKLPNNVFLLISGLSKVNARIAVINDRIKEIMAAQEQMADDDELDVSLVAAVANKKGQRETETIESEKIDLTAVFEDFGIDVENV